VNVEIKDLSETRKTLVVTLDTAEVATEAQAVVGEFSKQARIPGFRPGKAPAAMVARRFAKEIAEESQQKVVAKAYRSALEETKLDVLTVIDLQPGEIAEGKPATVSITVDLRPSFTLPDYAGLLTQILPVEATDAEVDQMIEGMRAERADFKVAERPSQKGDYVKLAYEGTVDGKPILDLAPDRQVYAKVPQTWEEVEGANEGLIPGLGLQLSGLKAGEKRDIPVTFPAEFAAVPALAGKAAVYAVEVLEVRERVLPPLDEAFFKANRADNLEGLKANVQSNIKGRKEYENRQAQRRQVSEAIAAKVDFPLPESMVEAETQGALRRFIEENMRRGVPAEQFEKDKKALHESARAAALVRVKTQLILARIAEQEKLQVSERDIDAYLYRESMMTQQRPEKLVKELTQDRERLRSVQQAIIFEKSLDLLVSKATVTTVAPQA
jgi:trigger factor